MSPHVPSRLPLRYAISLLVAASFVPTVQAADLLAISQDALNHSASLNSSRSTFRSTEAAQGVARGALLPQISATGSVYHTRTIESQEYDTGDADFGSDTDTETEAGAGNGTQVGGGAAVGAGGAGGLGGGSDDNYNGGSLGVSVSQALFDATNWYQYEQSKQQVGQQALQLEIDQQQLLYDVSSAYFEILRASEVLEARQAQEKAIARQQEQAQEQFNVGIVAITDVNEAQAAFDSARAQRIAAKNELQVSFEALERLTGQQYDSIEGLADDLPIEPPMPASRTEWVDLAMESSPSIQFAQQAVELSRTDVDIARAGYLPTLSAYGDYTYSNNDQEQLRGHNEGVEFGVQANLPIYTGGSTSASVRQNTYALEATQYDFEDQRRFTTQQVRSLYTQVANDVETVQAQREAIVSNRSALEATRAGYEVGTRNIVDVLDAEQSLYEAISDYADARYTYVTDLLELRQQAGTLNLDVLRSVNEWLRDEESVELDMPDEGMSAIDDIGERPTPPTL
ncbi:TolC family outer membrane protein [Salinicola halophilus]|uniref:TolC family outer membrane protein n=1 Tax=Salinicola halophilus TaxID=184065 RepID=UPI000DA178CA|nr:TolC family outer membrane protein [Salinicola halophilus]